MQLRELETVFHDLKMSQLHIQTAERRTSFVTPITPVKMLRSAPLIPSMLPLRRSAKTTAL